MEYKIVSSTQGIDDFTQKVNGHLRNGWVVLGSPFVLPPKNEFHRVEICQAVTRG